MKEVRQERVQTILRFIVSEAKGETRWGDGELVGERLSGRGVCGILLPEGLVGTR